MWKRIFSLLGKETVGVFSKESHSNSMETHKAVLAAAVKELSRKGTASSQENKKGLFNGVGLLSRASNDMKILSLEELETIGTSYFEGINGFEQDKSRAILYWKESSEKGSVIGKYRLAVCIRDGIGMQKDSVVAYSNLHQLATMTNFGLAHAAARAGVPPSLHNIGNMYAVGLGTEKDDKKAFKYYEAAMEAGDPLAKFSMAMCLSTGRGVVLDSNRAFLLFLECAEKGHPMAAFNVGAAYLGGVGTAVDANKAAMWFLRAGELGVMEGYVNLGNMYRQGVGFPRDLQKAIEVFSRGAERSEVCKELSRQTADELALAEVSGRSNNNNNIS